MPFERMSSATENIFHQAREVDGRSISSVRKFARTIHMAAVRVQRTRSQSEFIDQMITWFGECADGYIAPQLENPVAQSNISDFTIAVVTAGLLLIPNSDDLVNRVACFCNSQVFDTLIITIDPNQFQDRLSTAVQQAFLDATGMSTHYSFTERRAALFGQVQVDDVGVELVRALTSTTVSIVEWQLIAHWMNFPYTPPDASVPSQWRQVICEVLRQLRVDIQLRISIPATLSSQDIAQELLPLRDDSSHGQTVRSSGSTTGTGHDEGSTSSQRVPLQDRKSVV